MALGLLAETRTLGPARSHMWRPEARLYAADGIDHSNIVVQGSHVSLAVVYYLGPQDLLKASQSGESGGLQGKGV